jgi:hypothetical protein
VQKSDGVRDGKKRIFRKARQGRATREPLTAASEATHAVNGRREKLFS